MINSSHFALYKSTVSVSQNILQSKEQLNFKLIMNNSLNPHSCLLSIFTNTPFLGPRVLDDFNSRGT